MPVIEFFADFSTLEQWVPLKGIVEQFLQKKFSLLSNTVVEYFKHSILMFLFSRDSWSNHCGKLRAKYEKIFHTLTRPGKRDRMLVVFWMV